MTLDNKLPEASQLKRMMDAMQLGWWQADFTKEVYTCSDLIVDYLGMDSNEISFEEFIQIVRPDYRAHIAEQFAALVFSDEYEQVFPIQIAEKTVWVHSKLLKKESSEKGMIVSGVIQIIKKAEEGLQEPVKRQVDELIEKQNSIYISLLSFLESEDIEPVIKTALHDVMTQFQGSRIALFEYSEDGTTQSCTYEISDGETGTRTPFSKEFPTANIPWWTRRMRSGLPVIISTLDELPGEAPGIKKILTERGVCSLIAAPLMSRDRTWGFIMVDHCEPKEWTREAYQCFCSIAGVIGFCMQFHAQQTKIRNDQQNISNLYKYMPAGYVRVKLLDDATDYVYLDVNEAAIKMLGVPLDKFIGSRASQVEAEMDYRGWEIPPIVNTDRHITLNFDVKQLGKNFHAVIFSPGQDEIAVLFSDITEMVTAQTVLEQNEEKLRNIYQNLPVGIELYDKDGVLVDMNEKELEIFGLSRKEDALGVNVFDNPNIPDEVKEKLRRKEKVEFTLNYDFGIVGDYYDTLHKKVIFLVTIATPIFDAQGELTNYMFINIDNTETVTSHQRIEAFEEMTSLVGQFAQVGYANFDAYTREGSALDSWYVNLGEEPGIPLTEVVGVLNHVHPEDKPAIGDFFAAVKRGEAKHLRHDVRITASDGSQRWTRLNVMVRSYNPDEQKIAMVCVNYDITALKETEQNLIEARDKAQMSDRLKSAFLANMSHEIRTPLNAIVGFSNLLAETETAAERKQYMSVVQQNNELLLKLISDILDISKIEAGTMEFSSEPVDVYQICKEVIQSFSIKVSEAIELKFDDNLPHISIRGDKKRIVQVLSNFMTNAIKFTESGSITLSYEISGPGQIRFIVRDTGIGIASDKQQEVFNRFVKLDAFAQGTGLGLSICQSLVEKMGGSIGVDSEQGKGSDFWFTHPCDPSLEPVGKRLASVEPAASGNEAASANEKIYILVAEDIDSNYMLLETLLHKDYRLKRAYNGHQVIELYNKERPRIILMDMKMPEMDGLEATQKIRETDPSIPIIALTAFAFDSDREKAFNVGCDDFLTKPISPAALREAILKWIR